MAGRKSESARRQYWLEVMGRWRQSGQSVRQFCRDAGLREPSFYFWRRDLATDDGRLSVALTAPKRAAGRRRVAEPARTPERSTPSSPFVPIRVVGGAGGEDVPGHRGVEIVLSPGRRVLVQPGFDRQTLAEVLAVLEARPC